MVLSYLQHMLVRWPTITKFYTAISYPMMSAACSCKLPAQVAGEMARIQQLVPIINQILQQFGLGTVSTSQNVLERLVSRLPRLQSALARKDSAAPLSSSSSGGMDKIWAQLDHSNSGIKAHYRVNSRLAVPSRMRSSQARS